MDEISTNIKDRILEIADHKQISKGDFIESLNQKYSNYRGVSKKSSPSAEVIAEISTRYTDINIEWVLTGRGSMIKSSACQEAEHMYTTLKVDTDFSIPLIPIGSISSPERAGNTSAIHEKLERYTVPAFRDCNIEFLIRMQGDSMQPTYRSGDLLGCRRLPRNLFFQWNRVYVLDTIQGPLIQRIQQSAKADHLLCISDHEAYPPFELNFDTDVQAIAIVLGAIRIE